ncbi:MAG: hypothetical protein LBR90_00715 [Elusimicrobiota bacterium]|jgi:lipoate-protein ligase A|nr:hypothetical protein [Elusimicrobiota bacterium]
MARCLFVESVALDVYGQMALDDILVPRAAQGLALARFYNWRQTPAATFGYAQFENTARSQIQEAGIKEFTRRPTGGGVVLHKDDLTFSLIFTQAANLKPSQIYSRLHALIKEEFERSGVALGVYNAQSDYRPAVGGVSQNCFTNPVADDLMRRGGGKVLGGAIRRFGGAILYQGSLQLPAARQNKAYQSIIKTAALKFLEAKEEREILSNAVLNEAYSLAHGRYGAKEWVEKF